MALVVHLQVLIKFYMILYHTVIAAAKTEIAKTRRY
jgi:hypothetical protein